MGMFVNPDNLAFQAALNARIYVDKSGILNYTNSVLGSTDAFICNSRPRRFGKSVTANEYSCAVTPQVRQTGNRLSGLAGTAYASLLA